MTSFKYLKPGPNGTWKFRKALPPNLRLHFKRRELKFTIRAKNVFEATQIGMMICTQVVKLIEIIEMSNQEKKSKPIIMEMVTFGNLSRNKKGEVTLENLKFNQNDQQDLKEISQLLGLTTGNHGFAQDGIPFMLSEVLEINLTKRNLTPVTRKKIERVYQLAFDAVGDFDLNAADAKSNASSLIALAKLEPLRRTQNKNLAGKSFKEQLDYAEQHQLDRVSGATVKNLINLLSSSIQAIFELDSRLKQNPITYKQTRLVLGKSQTIQSSFDDEIEFNDDEIHALFSANNIRKIKVPALLIGSFIGLNTGMRVNEVASLHVEHIVNKDGIYCFDLTKWTTVVSEENTGKASLKNEASRRLIPISERLLKAGLLRYVELVEASGSQLLFPNMSWYKVGGFGRNLSRNFVKYRAFCGITDKKDFHTLRGTLNNRMKQKGISREFREDLLGHANPSMNSRHYSNSTSLLNLQKIVNQIKFPELNFFEFFTEDELTSWLSKELKK